MIGVARIADPGDLTLRQIFLRYRGVTSSAWDHTCTLQATIYAIASGKTVSAAELHPYRSPPKKRRKKLSKKEARATAKELSLMLKERAKRG